MVGTQIETRRESGTPQAESQGFFRKRAAVRLPNAAFTLTELLVVITIIAILAALITGAALNAKKRADQARITLELQQIGSALENFKNEFGAYPPNGMNNGAPDSGVDLLVKSDFVRIFKKAFPRSQEPEDLIRALASTTVATGGGTYNIVVPSGGGGLSGAEAVYFWLGGFSKDTAYPISGPGGPSFQVDASVPGNGEVLEDRSNSQYEFDLGRLGPRTADNTFDESAGNGRFITYDDPRPGAGAITRRINFWLYTPEGSNLPMAYFDTSRHTPEEYDVDISGIAGANIYALKQLREGIAAADSNADIRFVEDKKFQLLHPGIDDIWGDGFAGFQLDIAGNGDDAWDRVVLAPEGPFIGDVADTLGSFMPGTLEDKQE